MGARNNDISENIVWECVQGGEQAIGMVIAGDSKKPKKVKDHM